MKADYLIARLNNEGITVRAVGGRVELQPRHKVTEEMQSLVREHLAVLLAELARWPCSQAPARNFLLHPPRPDELGREAVRRPRVVPGGLRRLLSGRPRRR
jgi:hypothetical protein